MGLDRPSVHAHSAGTRDVKMAYKKVLHVALFTAVLYGQPISSIFVNENKKGH